MSPARQLVTMVNWGMTPAQALRSATIHGAELMQIQNVWSCFNSIPFATAL